MLAPSQRSVSVVVMAVWAAAHDYGLKALNRQQLCNRSASHGHSEIVGNLPRPVGIALLDCNKFGRGMCEQCGDMGVGSPPSRSDYAAFDSFWHEATSTVQRRFLIAIEMRLDCSDNCWRRAMRSATSAVYLRHSCGPVEMKVVFRATAKCP